MTNRNKNVFGFANSKTKPNIAYIEIRIFGGIKVLTSIQKLYFVLVWAETCIILFKKVIIRFNNNNNNNNMTLFNEGNIIYWLPSSLQYGPP